MADTQTRDSEIDTQEDFELWENEFRQGKVPIEGEGKSSEELEFEKDSSEKAKINIVEAVIVLLATAMADLAELIPLFGVVLGMLFSAGILLWSYFKGMYTARRRALKIALMLGGPILELMTLGLFPETFTLFAAILVHNYGETKHTREILQKLSKKNAP